MRLDGRCCGWMAGAGVGRDMRIFVVNAFRMSCRCHLRPQAAKTVPELEASLRLALLGRPQAQFRVLGDRLFVGQVRNGGQVRGFPGS